MVEIKIRHGNITKLGPGDFDGPEKLTHLTVYSNKIAKFEKGWANNLGHLNLLNLSTNKIERLDGHFFTSSKSMPNLEVLQFYNNPIQHFDGQLFELMPNLRTLNLNNTNLGKFNLNNLVGLKKLNWLDLRNINEPVFLDSPIPALAVEELLLPLPGDKEMPDINYFKNLKNLKVLRLTGGPQKVLKKIWIDKIPTLEVLDVMAGIETIEKENFSHLQNLKELQIIGTGLKTIKQKALSGLYNLEQLTLGNSSLVEKLPHGLFLDLKNLKGLKINYTFIKELPPNLFSGLVNLVNLDLSRNTIKTFSIDSFAGPDNLKELYLGGNEIRSLGNETFKLLKNLETLDIYSNEIDSLSAHAFKSLENLSSLDLRSNSLQSIEPGAFKSLSSIRNLSLDRKALTNLGTLPEAVTAFIKFDISENGFSCNNYVVCDSFLLQRPSGFTQMEEVIPAFIKFFLHNYQGPDFITQSYYASFPKSEGGLEWLNHIRQLAVDVCAVIESFCPAREQIHAFPRQQELDESIALYAELDTSGEHQEILPKLEELIIGLKKLLNYELDYTLIATDVPVELRKKTDALFEKGVKLNEIAPVAKLIYDYLVMNADISNKELKALLSIKSYIDLQFKKQFWQLDTSVIKKTPRLLLDLIELSRGMGLLTDRETLSLKSLFDKGASFKAIAERSIQWITKRIDYSQNKYMANQLPNYYFPDFIALHKSEQYDHYVRTSYATEWNRYLF